MTFDLDHSRPLRVTCAVGLAPTVRDEVTALGYAVDAPEQD